MCTKAHNKCLLKHYIVCCTRPRGARKLDTYCKILKYLKFEDKACDVNQHIKNLTRAARNIQNMTNGLAAAIWSKTTTTPTTTTTSKPPTTGTPQQPQQPMTDTSTTRKGVPATGATAPAPAPSSESPGFSASTTTSTEVPTITPNSHPGTTAPTLVVEPDAVIGRIAEQPLPLEPAFEMDEFVDKRTPPPPAPSPAPGKTRPGPTTAPTPGKPGLGNNSNCDTLLSLLADFHGQSSALDTFMDGSKKDRRAFDDDLMDQMVPYVQSVRDFLERVHGVCGGTQEHCVDDEHQKTDCVGTKPRINVTRLENAGAAYLVLARGTYGPTRNVHPRGRKWWRYRWGYTFVESVLLVLCLIPMYPIRRCLVFGATKVSGPGYRRVGKSEDLYWYPFFNFALGAITLQLTYFLFQFLGEFTTTYDLLYEWVRHLLALRYSELMVQTVGIVPFSGDDYRRQLLIILYHLFGAHMLYSLFVLVVVWSFVTTLKAWNDWIIMPIGERPDKRPDGGYNIINQRVASHVQYAESLHANHVAFSDDMTAKYLLEFLGRAAWELSYEHYRKSVTLVVFALAIGGISYTLGFALYQLLDPCLLLAGCCVAAAYSWMWWLRRCTVTRGHSVGGYGFATIDRVIIAVQCIVFWFSYMLARVALSAKFLRVNLKDPFYDHVVAPLVEPLGGPANMPPHLYIFVQALWVVVLAAVCTHILTSLICLLALPPNVSPKDFEVAFQKCMEDQAPASSRSMTYPQENAPGSSRVPALRGLPPPPR